MKNWRIKVLTGASGGKIFPVQPGLTLGRKRAHINLADPKASSIHAMIKKTRTGKLVLVDNDSRNGTKVGGEKRRKIILKPGVTFQIGSTKCEIIDFSAYLRSKSKDAQQVKEELYQDFHGDELSFGSTDYNETEMDRTELDRGSDHQSADVKVIESPHQGNHQGSDHNYYQDEADVSQKITSAHKLNIKRYEEKSGDSLIKPSDGGPKFNVRKMDGPNNSPGFSAPDDLDHESTGDMDFSKDLATNPSFEADDNFKNSIASELGEEEDMDVDVSGVKSDSPPQLSSTPQELDKTHAVEMSKNSHSGIPVAAVLASQTGDNSDDPFGKLEMVVESAEANVIDAGTSDVDLNQNPILNDAVDSEKDILATTPQESVSQSPEGMTKTMPIGSPSLESNIEKTENISDSGIKYDGQAWDDAVDQAIESVGRHVENDVQSMQPFVPGIRLVFTQGPQLNTTWTLGYGPRSVGPDSSEFPIIEQNVPGVCFTLYPTEKGVMFQTDHPDKIKLNGASIKIEILSDGDSIKIGESAIEVETF
ncbi:MAG: hypothetical protein CL677_06660 [Bdellovibrionaceae bacterium]|nr:hypothetical protein [Pseudobdellovibrionaceae bacterium]|tara:strand:+ start:92858 stop:94462 length:1605 start_codon:yes stop_codon:yes gene_type:complete